MFSFKQILPILFGVVMLVSFAVILIPKSFYKFVFIGNNFFDPLFGALFGSVLTGNPITSYIIANELLLSGVSLIAVIAFILAWVTVGVIQFPAESLMLGKRFVLVRNIVSFVSAIIIACLTVLTLSLI
ncbi:hypothetical protein KAI92_04705 [Candidatus Parcubacteria bacterium]|nr:hypothetical protein [Candidatus Parcubacteria bacterium]